MFHKRGGRTLAKGDHQNLMEEFDQTLPMEGSLDSFVSNSGQFTIYTHAQRTRIVIMALFLCYMVFFTAMLKRLLTYLSEMGEIAPVFQDMVAESAPLTYLLALVGFLIATGFLIYFLWAVVDIWGLQVCVSPIELRVQNTIIGYSLRQHMGTGSLLMEDIEEIRGGRFFTYVSAKGHTVRFSPVEHLDGLVARILTHAPEAHIVE